MSTDIYDSVRALNLTTNEGLAAAKPIIEELAGARPNLSAHLGSAVMRVFMSRSGLANSLESLGRSMIVLSKRIREGEMVTQLDFSSFVKAAVGSELEQALAAAEKLDVLLDLTRAP